jgi:type I restriction enzyme S subunit
VLNSLAKVPDMERELLAAAVAGEIVAQVPDDEPAEVLLTRLGPPPIPPKPRRGTGRFTEVRNSRRSKGPPREGALDLAAVLKRSGGPLSLPEIYARANFDRDQTEHVERFYLR